MAERTSRPEMDRGHPKGYCVMPLTRIPTVRRKIRIPVQCRCDFGNIGAAGYAPGLRAGMIYFFGRDAGGTMSLAR
jgi:hypothetical protein